LKDEMDSLSSAIKIESVWKVFGNTSKDALDAIQNKGISKTEALENITRLSVFLTFHLTLSKVKYFV